MAETRRISWLRPKNARYVLGTTTRQRSAGETVALQSRLRPALTHVAANKDYALFRQQLETLDTLLRDSHLESMALVFAVEGLEQASVRRQAARQQFALTCRPRSQRPVRTAAFAPVRAPNSSRNATSTTRSAFAIRGNCSDDSAKSASPGCNAGGLRPRPASRSSSSARAADCAAAASSTATWLWLGACWGIIFGSSRDCSPISRKSPPRLDAYPLFTGTRDGARRKHLRMARSFSTRALLSPAQQHFTSPQSRARARRRSAGANLHSSIENG